MPQSYLAHIHHFLTFLTAYIHTLLALRDLYPRATFLTARFHNTPVFQSRHPTLCTWITDAVSAVRTELLAGTVARIAVVIYHQPPTSLSPSPGTTKVLERHLIDVSRFPAVPKQDWETAVAFAPAPPVPAAAAAADAEPPVGHPQPWIPVQPSLQRTRGGSESGSGSAGGSADDMSGEGGGRSAGAREGADLGGARTTPIRAVEAGVLSFEMWVEEGKAKLEMASQGSAGAESSRG
ncbi:DNA-binding protein [Glonium stellatum]|uniref:DNA-binding protein n=1 Tax=Glonium stellatum TaxID=574774 RepID=A0A8E2F1Z0_9PEZI|nr:DNA-binding protein [Glonium stellatum]